MHPGRANPVDVADLCRACAVHAERIIELVDAACWNLSAASHRAGVSRSPACTAPAWPCACNAILHRSRRRGTGGELLEEMSRCGHAYGRWVASGLTTIALMSGMIID